MGIPGFFKWLTGKNRYPDIVKKCVEEEPYYDENGVFRPIDETNRNPNGTEFHNLYLDMNGIIHSCANSNNNSKLKNEDEVIKSVFDYIDRVFSIVRPRKLLYIAIDGVAPRAKLNQQRGRRFFEIQDSINTNTEIEKIKSKILACGNFLPADPNQPGQIESFDENCITPGTSFMMHLTDCLRYYVYNRMNTNAAWRNIKVILSDTNVPGEGEHKIINFIRRQRAQRSYNPNTNHVLFGTDADLIVLGMATHEPNITIMRNEFSPGKPRPCIICHQLGHDFKDCKGISKENLGQSHGSTLDHIKIKYIFVNLSILRDQLFRAVWENDPSWFEWDSTRFIDDWVFICLLIGNDFIPGLPSFEIHEDAIDDLLLFYSWKVPEFNNYLTDNGKIQMNLLRQILVEFGQREERIFRTRHEINQRWLNNNRVPEVRATHSFNPAEIINQRERPMIPQFRPSYSSRTSNSSANTSAGVPSSSHQTPVSNSPSLTSSNVNGQEESHILEDTVRLWEEDWHARYYQQKFNADREHLNECRRKVVEDYTRGLHWVLQYYYRDVPSWDWYYPHHYAPFASDFEYSTDIPVQFNNNSKPFKPLEQLISVLPAQCAKHLPEAWQSLVTDKDSPISEFYPQNFRLDPNGKRYKSQYTVLLPFVDENRLNQVLQGEYGSLTLEETTRNEEKNDLLFIHTENSNYTLLKQQLDVGSGRAITYGNPAVIPTMIEIPGSIWQDSMDDKIVLIGKSIKAPLDNYKNISNNQVMCVKYRR